MKKKLLIALLVMIVGVTTVSVISAVNRSKSRNALAAYKANLRAKGEKLTFAELGLPGTLESNANLEEFVALADRMSAKSLLPGSIEFRNYRSPGRIAALWRGGNLRHAGSTAGSGTDVDWTALASDMENCAEMLAKLRAELEHPPRHFGWNYTNPFAASQPKNPFVQKRKAAQFLATDCLLALHEHQLARAQTNLHSLTQLVQVHRDDWTLISAMIRVAISGLALDCTWQALQADDWDDEALARLQHDWESVDLVASLENGFAGERAFSQQSFAELRAANAEGSDELISTFNLAGIGGATSSTGFKRLQEEVSQRAAIMYWRNHMDEDEMLWLSDSQHRLETIRRLKTNVSAASLQISMKTQQDALVREFDVPLGKLRHLFSALSIPNFTRAFEGAVKGETQRRTTIIAIAIRRYHLQYGQYPVALSQLTPQFLSHEWLDPWCGRPFGYRLDADGSFTLYSVGVDGRDHGGDPAPAQSTNAPPDLWIGKDAVWPVPVLSNER